MQRVGDYCLPRLFALVLCTADAVSSDIVTAKNRLRTIIGLFRIVCQISNCSRGRLKFVFFCKTSAAFEFVIPKRKTAHNFARFNPFLMCIHFRITLLCREAEPTYDKFNWSGSFLSKITCTARQSRCATSTEL
jgi:hypothetical protein